MQSAYFAFFPMVKVTDRVGEVEKSLSSLHGWIKGASVVGLALVGVCGWWLNSQFLPEFRGVQSSIQDQGKRLTILEGYFNRQRDQAEQSLANHALLPLPDFKANLPDVGASIAKAKQQEVEVAPKVIDDLQHKLIAAGEDDPGFWPAAAEFISYRSQIAMADFQSLLRPDLPNCTDHDPVPLPPPLEELAASGYKNCVFTLDSAKDDAKLNSLVASSPDIIIFVHCLIVYRGGPIDLRIGLKTSPAVAKLPVEKRDQLWPALPAVQFSNCLFSFTMRNAPSSEGKDITRTLLAGNVTALEIPTHPPATHS